MAEGYSDLNHSLSDTIDSVDNLEEALIENREYIVKNLNVMSLLINQCSFKDIISEDEQGKIRSCYESGMTVKAADLFINAILRSKDETKWSVFKEALNRSEGNELIKDILHNGVTKSLIAHEANQAQFNLQRGRIAEQWNTEQVCEALRQEQVLTLQEYQEVVATLRSQGSYAANHQILNTVPRRKNFLAKTLTVLWGLGYKKSVKLVDLDFFRKMEARSEYRGYSKKLNTSDDDDGDDDDDDDDDDNAKKSVVSVCDDDNTCADAIGVNHLAYHSLPNDVGNMAFNITADFPNDDMKMMTNFITNNLNQSDDGPVASRTRSKTKLLQTKDPYGTVLRQSVLEDRHTVTSHKQSETPHRPRETSSLDQAAVQHPRSYLLDASKMSELSKDADINVTLKESKAQTDSNIVCICGKRFIFLEELRTHENTDCKATIGNSTEKQRQLHGDHDGWTAPMARFKTELAQTTIPDETCLNKPIVNYRQAGTSYKPRETSSEQAVFQPLKSDSFDGSKKSAQVKDAAIEFSLQQGNKHPNNNFLVCVCEKQFISKDELRKHQSKDCQIKLGHYPGNQFELDRGAAMRARAEKDKQTNHKGKLETCVCEKRFVSEDALIRHQNTDCQLIDKKCAAGTNDAKPVILQTGRNQTKQIRKLVSCRCDKRFVSEDALRRHQNTDCRLTDKKCAAGKNDAKPVILQAGKNQTKQIRKLVSCRCDKRFVSEDALRRHQKTECRVLVDPDKNSPLPSQNQYVPFRPPFDPLKKVNSGKERDTRRYFNRMEGQGFNTVPQTDRSVNIKPVDRAQATASKPKYNTNNEIARVNRNMCTCGTQFISQEALQRHVSFVCKAQPNKTISEDTMIKSVCGDPYPMAKNKSNLQDVPRDHTNTNNIKPREWEINGKQDGYLGVVKTTTQVAQHENAQAREISHEETMRKTFSYNPEHSVKTESSMHNSEQTTSLREHSYRGHVIQCVCGNKFMSEAHLDSHLKNCLEFIHLTNQTDDDESYIDTRNPFNDHGFVELVQNTASCYIQDTPDFICHCGEVFESHELFTFHRTRKQCSSELQDETGETSLVFSDPQDMTSKTSLKHTPSPPKSDYRSRKEETTHKEKTQGFDLYADFFGAFPNSGLQDTTENNDRSNSQISNTEDQETRSNDRSNRQISNTEDQQTRSNNRSNSHVSNTEDQQTRSNNRSNSQISNTEIQETRPNNRHTQSTQESAGGFGFQSPRTLQLNKRR